jgi:prolyl-tRNA synthetase
MKTPLALGQLPSLIPSLLATIQADMFKKAKDVYDSRLREVTKWEDVVPTLDNKCVVVMPWCEAEACEDDIKERSGRTCVSEHGAGLNLSLMYANSAEPQDERAPSAGAKSLAIPIDQERWSKIESGKTKCPACGMDAKRWTMFGRSY